MITISIVGDVCPKDRQKKIANKDFGLVFGFEKPNFTGSDVSITNF